MDALLAFLPRLIPALPKISPREMLRIVIGALVGIGLTAIVTAFLFPGSALPYLVPPLGASAVLLFGVPASPLAQPWSIIGGNMVSAIVGVTIALLVPNIPLAAALAVSLAILAMILLRCLHPPGGAMALTAVLGPPAIHAAGYGFVLMPAGLNSLLLLLVALAYNNLTGHRYPHALPAAKPAPHKTDDPPPSARAAPLLPSDLQSVLAQYPDIIDVDPADLEALLHALQTRVMNRRSGEITVGDVMSRDVVALRPESTLAEALALMNHHDIRLLPVISWQGVLEGVFTQTDLLRGFGEGVHADTTAVTRYMTAKVETAKPDQLIGTLVPAMSDRGIHGMPVVEPDGRLAGMLTQSDLIAALFARRAGI